MFGESNCVQIEITVIPRADASLSIPGYCALPMTCSIIAAENGGIWGGVFIDQITGFLT
jgi:hypothetical protein